MTVKKCGQDRDNIFFTGTENDFSFKKYKFTPGDPESKQKGKGEKQMKPVGIIGGSGFYELLENPRMFVHNNKYGRSSEIFEGMIQGRKVYFLPRHGGAQNHCAAH